MEQTLRTAARRQLGAEPLSLTPLGGGFYGRVFLAKLPAPPFDVVLKLYLKPRLGAKERLQLSVLGSYGTLPMPKTLFLHEADGEAPYDVLGMEYLPGLNAGITHIPDEDARERIGDEIVENLVAWHSVVHPEGFGELDGDVFDPDWQSCYYRKAEKIFREAEEMAGNGRLTNNIYAVVRRAFARFDEIFFEPVPGARLLHGDYNTWNIQLNSEMTHAVSVIDPYGSCWGDPEMDLYQLRGANGEDFRLMAKYAQRMPLSRYFPLKDAFYEVFTEIMHYHDSGVEVDAVRLGGQANRLLQQLNAFSIR